MGASSLILTLLVALVSAAGLTPLVISCMWKWGILDAPDGVRKLHGRTVPLAGGLAVLAGCVLASVTSLWKNSGFLLERQDDIHFVIGLLSASVWVTALGIVDDKGLLRGRQKFLGQIVAALMLTSSGCVISRLEFLSVSIELGMLSIPFTIFWLVGTINAVNLMDGVDGLATSIGAVLSGVFALMSLITGHDLEATLSVALCGALLGFLPYNFPHARIFLGDTGSMLIGLLLGTLALRSSVKSQATLTIAAPLAVLSLLIFDVVMAILRRKLTGRSLYCTDRGHLHHRLVQLGFPPAGVVLFVSLACALCSGGALTSLVYRNDLIALAVAGTVLASCVAAKVFGHNEFRLLLNRSKGFARSLFRLTSPCGSKGLVSAMQIQGHLNWSPVWSELKEFAQQFDVVRVEFHISAPRIHEHYHADWTRRSVEADRLWRTTIPLVHMGTLVGHIHLCGELAIASHANAACQVAEIVSELKPIELSIEDLLASALPVETAPSPSAAA